MSDNVDDAFIHALSDLIAVLSIMEPLRLKRALDLIPQTLEEDVMPTQKLKDAYNEVLKVVPGGSNPGTRDEVRAALRRWRKARDEADAIIVPTAH